MLVLYQARIIILRDDGIVNFLDMDFWSSVLLRSQLSFQKIFMGGSTLYHQPGDVFINLAALLTRNLNGIAPMHSL